MRQKKVDLAILGGGSAAFAAAEEAVRAGAHVAMVEEGAISGTCLNRGCVPSKYMIHRSKVFAARHPGTRDASGWSDIVAGKNKRLQEGQRAKQDFLKRHRSQISYFPLKGIFLSAQTIRVPETLIHFSHAVIATGGSPEIPLIAGLSETPFYTSDTIFDLPRLPEALLVIGSGPVGLEIGQLFSRLGVRVTLVASDARLLPSEEPEVGRMLENVLHTASVRVLTQSIVARVQQKGRGIIAEIVNKKGSRLKYKFAAVLVATGRQANSQHIGLELAGVRMDSSGGIEVDSALKTSQKNIWAAGDCVACDCPNHYVYVAKRQGRIAAHNAFHPRALERIDYRLVPRVIFTEPEIASVGVTEAAARKRGLKVISKTLPLANVPRAWLQSETQGLIKMVVENERLIGVSVMASRAGEVIHEAALAMQFNAKVRDFSKLFHAYPTFSEALPMCAALFRAE